jgi:DNA-binding transcriptional ArsR family regulator
MTKRLDVRCTSNQSPLLTPIEAGGMAAVFKVLANETRLRILYAFMYDVEMCVTDLAATIGMKPQAVFNQLQRLSDLGILASRRDGKSVVYRVADDGVLTLLYYGWCIVTDVNAPNRPARAEQEVARLLRDRAKDSSGVG